MSCCICRREFSGFGHNAFPFSAPGDGHAVACEGCNMTMVIHTRLLCASLKLTSPADAHAFAKRYAHALRVRKYPKCGHLMEDLLNEYRSQKVLPS